MSNREQRARAAAETLEILRSGSYLSPSGNPISIETSIKLAIDNTVLFTPDRCETLPPQAAELIERLPPSQTEFEITNETTLAVARRLVSQFGPTSVAALNFASAKNPGGGFQSGSQAQEESLARASGLYACLEHQNIFYDENRKCKSLLYTDHMIVAPNVPVFRDDEDRLIEQPWELTMITSPAPNAAAIARNEPKALPLVEPTLKRRAEYILSAAIIFKQPVLVLGAWGCGVFGNDPGMVARIFARLLGPQGTYGNAFKRVAFAVFDLQGQIFSAFENEFLPHKTRRRQA